MGKRFAVVFGLASCLLAGCFDVEQSLVLEKDLSGKAGFNMGVDLEPMMMFMLQFQREMQGKTGAPTAEEIAQAKQEFLSSRKSENDPQKIAAQKAELEKSLPPGVKLLASDFKDEGLKFGANFQFGFDDVKKLGLIRIPDEKQQEGAPPGPENPFDEPFANLQLVDEGETLLLTSRTTNPIAEQEQQMEGMELSPDARKQMEDAFKGLRVAVKVEAPFEVVETNATRREGKTLIWEYDMAAFQKLAQEKKEPEGVRVRYRK